MVSTPPSQQLKGLRVQIPRLALFHCIKVSGKQTGVNPAGFLMVVSLSTLYNLDRNDVTPGPEEAEIHNRVRRLQSNKYTRQKNKMLCSVKVHKGM